MKIGIFVAFMILLSPVAGQAPEAKRAASDAPPETTTENASEAPPAAPQPIPPADITSQASETATKLQKIESEILPSPEIARVAMNFFGEGQAAAELRVELAALNPNTATTRRIEDLRREWKLHSDQFDRWIEQVDKRWRELQATRTDLWNGCFVRIRRPSGGWIAPNGVRLVTLRTKFCSGGSATFARSQHPIGTS